MVSEVILQDRSTFAPRRVRINGRGWIGKLCFWILTVALLGLNAWWSWDNRPLDSLTTISGWIDQSRLADAEREARRWLRRSPHHGEARILLSRALAAKGDFLGSADQLHTVPLWWPTKGEILFAEGQSYLKADRARDAEAAWKAALADDPLHPVPAPRVTAAALELTKLYVLERRDDEASEVLWRRYGMAEDTAGRQFFVAKLLRLELERDTPEGAAMVLRRFVDSTPDDWEARRALALAEQSRGQPALASREILACLKGRPNDIRFWRDRLAILMAQNDFEGLASAVEHLPPAADHDGMCWKYRGMVCVHEQKWRQAASAFEKSLELEPGDVECHDQMAQLAERLGDREQAGRHRQQSQTLAAANVELRAALNDALASVGAAMTEPPPVFARLAELYKTLGHARQAEAWSRFIAPEVP